MWGMRFPLPFALVGNSASQSAFLVFFVAEFLPPVSEFQVLQSHEVAPSGLEIHSAIQEGFVCGQVKVAMA
jgi:hypothetical protein